MAVLFLSSSLYKKGSGIQYSKKLYLTVPGSLKNMLKKADRRISY